MYFQHQSNEQLQILNAEFKDILYGGIGISIFDQQSLSLTTKVKMSNVTAHDIEALYRSFIIAEINAELDIEDSHFYYINNLESGSVIQATYKEAVIDITRTNFNNNTSIEGAVFVTDSKSVIK